MEAIDNLEISIKALEVYPIEPNIIKDMLRQVLIIKDKLSLPVEAVVMEKIANQHNLTQKCKEKRFFQVKCEECGWEGCSCLLKVERSYDDCQTYCPKCEAPDPEEDEEYDSNFSA